MLCERTKRFQGIQRASKECEGIQRNTKGTRSRTEWCANVQRDSQDYNELPRNAMENNEILRNTRKYKRSTKWRRMVCECTKRFPRIQRDSKDYEGIVSTCVARHALPPTRIQIMSNTPPGMRIVMQEVCEIVSTCLCQNVPKEHHRWVWITQKTSQFMELCAQTVLSPPEYRPFMGLPKKHQLRPRSRKLAITKRVAYETLSRSNFAALVSETT